MNQEHIYIVRHYDMNHFNDVLPDTNSQLKVFYLKKKNNGNFNQNNYTVMP